jgi:NADPH-dependent 2,4-dienoyl-CoA reductase/sulfur reductase-like enzyme
MSGRTTRRDIVKLMGAAAIAGVMPQLLHPAWAQARGRIVIIGGGFGGATCARYLRRLAPALEVSLIELNDTFVTCPFSNTVIGGLNEMSAITHTYDKVRAAGVRVVRDRAAAIDAAGRNVRLASGSNVPYDRLVVSPGVDFKWGAIEGYDEAAAEIMPHAYKAGPQTALLRRQLESMPDGGVVVMTIPANPFRCPPGPYERASLIAHYLKTLKPRSKILLLDAKDTFSKMGLFREAWAQLYGPLLEWVPFARNGMVRRVDTATKTIHTDFGQHRADVANVIPPQRAATIVDTAGLADGGDWCNVNPTTFESRVVPGIHVLGDAIIAGSMPKSGFSAGSQAKVCAYAIVALQSGMQPAPPTFINTCYSLVAPDYGISVADVYKIGGDGTIQAVMGAGGVSPTGASAAFRALEAGYARSWYANITTEMFG